MIHSSLSPMANSSLSQNLLVARQYAAVVTAFTLPFSTSGQAIAVSILAVLAVLTLDRPRLAATLRSPAAHLPLLLVGFVLLGVMWSIAPFGPALKGVGPYSKLLLIPLLMGCAFTPKQAVQIGCGFVASCIVLLALSYASMLWPSGPWGWFKMPNIPVKDNAVQSECFALCAFGLAIGAIRTLRQGKRRPAVFMFLLAALFFANIFMIFLSKTGMLVAAAVLALFLFEVGGWKRILSIGVAALVLIALALWTSAPAQRRIAEMSIDMNAGNGVSETVSTASRLDFWNKAAGFVKQAPLLGHGTGSIQPLYQTLEATRPSPYGQAVSDPHNQFLHTTLQIGLLGGLVLLAMWAVHVRMFLGRDMASMVALAVIVQNLIGSLFNSHISQVTQGMTYCLAVGILGAVVLGLRGSQPDSGPSHARLRPIEPQAVAAK
jgi:O-antigen ligase